MKKIIIFILVAFCCAAQVALAEETLMVKAKFDGSQVKVRWLVKSKTLDYQYQLYRSPVLSPEKRQQLGSFAMVSYDEAKKRISKENEFSLKLLYPFESAANRAELNASLSQADNRINMVLLLSVLNPEVAALLGQSYNDLSVEPGTAYVYTVEAYKNKQLKASTQIGVSTLQATEMPMPWGVVAHRFPWGVGLKWQGYEPYPGFNIYRAESFAGPFEKINTAPTQVQTAVNDDGTVDVPPYFYSDTTITKDKTYFYEVRGIDFFGDLGPVSDIALGKVKIDPNPAPPTRPTLAPHDDRIDMQWPKSADETVIGYYVYRSFVQEGPYLKLNKDLVTGTAYSDNSALVDTNYFYTITAVNKGGFESMKSLSSLAVLRDATPPPVAQGVTSQLEETTVQLTWKAVQAPDLLGYRVYRTMKPTNLDWALLNKEPQLETSFAETLEKNLSRYPFYYRITAVDSHFNESAPSEIMKIQLPDVTPPAVPTFTGSSVRDGQVALTWTVVDIYDLAGYAIYRTIADHKVKMTSQLLLQPSFVDATPPVDTPLVYTVVSLDTTGNESELSSPMTLKVRDHLKPRISSFKAGVENGTVVLAIVSKDSDLAGFDVLRSRNNRDFSKINSARVNGGLRFVDEHPQTGKRYFYKVVLWDKAANKTESVVRELKMP